MVVYRGDLALKEYCIALGFTPNGAKGQQGDGKTQEGVFRIDRVNAQSRYHVSLGLDYPTTAEPGDFCSGCR